jgi:signal transduction histidine kinase
MDKSFLYFISKTAAVISSAILFFIVKVDVTFVVISTLSFACVFVSELLLGRTKRYKRLLSVTNLLCIIACFLLGVERLFPLFIILLIHLLDILTQTSMFYSIMSVILLLSFFIFPPDMTASIITLILVSLLLFCRSIIGKLSQLTEKSERQQELIIEQNKKLTDMRSLTKTLKYNASVEERNRIAARIHDQVGHGISGSIIMLEAALMLLKEHPQKAEESIHKAIANLRGGVDEIRMALRDERVEHYLVGKNEINAMLEEFKVSYNKNTRLLISGNLNVISLEQWSCIHDNTKECLTNLLKHSNATEFVLSIDVYKRAIKVEYKDNGSSSEDFEKGLGLEAMEERTIGAKGKCFFHKGERGFTVTNVFPC